MTILGAVVPDWVGTHDCDVVRYAAIALARHETRPDWHSISTGSRCQRLASHSRTKHSLCNAVVSGVECEHDRITNGCSHGIRLEDKATFADIDHVCGTHGHSSMSKSDGSELESKRDEHADVCIV